MHVVATAGHVDHGKSTLLRALTSQDPDRLAEEKKRGMSIELGYVWCDLAGVGDVAFIDVPGHQKFVATALSGLGQVPVALFVVAADDPWMPQATEHLHALTALGVDRGVLVVTRADLADPEATLAQAREHLRGTPLAGVPEVVVSAHTGEGMDLLRATLAGVLQSVPPPSVESPVRLWIDRHFNLRGSGTVVTGTLESGTVRIGDELETQLADEVRRVRVRTIESLGRRCDSVSGSARVALELAGRAARDIERG
ncbi:MAG: GTP-binding protein, partial [Mycobacteriaceae bacterium]